MFLKISVVKDQNRIHFFVTEVKEINIRKDCSSLIQSQLKKSRKVAHPTPTNSNCCLLRKLCLIYWNAICSTYCYQWVQPTLKVDPDLMKFFSKTLSRTGSSSSPTSSISSGRPRERLSSRWFLKYLWVRDVIYKQNGSHTVTLEGQAHDAMDSDVM